jgi:two-component system chemotaxis sensor kinase CheA
MTIDLASFRLAFLEEAREHVATLEKGVLTLESNPNDLETLREVFRAAHSMKGAAGTLGFTHIAEFTHHLETVLDAMRNGQMSVDRNAVTVLLKATDELQHLLARLSEGETVSADATPLRDLAAKLGRPAESGPQPLAVTRTAASSDEGASKRRLRISIVPTRKFFACGLDPVLLFRDLEGLGELEKVDCDCSNVPRLSELDPSECHVCWSVVLATNATRTDIEEVFVFVADDVQVNIEEEPSATADAAVPNKAESAGHHAPAHESSTLRVSSEKVDSIIDLVGELVIAQSMVMQLLGQSAVGRSPMLRDAFDSMARNMQELQERVMGIRMVPIATLFGRFSRIVRDTAASLGKTVQLELSGQDTEVDKAVVERLADPITHLVRNALDHGIETDAQRKAAGKSGPGIIRLSGHHVAGGVVVEVSDNGRGLDVARIREQAERRGLVNPSDQLTDEQIHALIFEPGFSTASEVSDLSGRGVGMDVVRRDVDALNGTVTVLTSPGAGTTVRIRLPLTLAILDGLLLRVGTQTYIVPLLAVTESFRPAPQAIKRLTGDASVAIVRETALPLVDLGVELGLTREQRRPEDALVVVVEADGRQVGLVVDALVGQSQVVVKSLETHYRRVDGVLGATILGDGKVAFIVDVSGLARLTWAKRSYSGSPRAA